MANITAAMVKELREMTGAGMMDCKKALGETDGDMDAAVEFLRKNGQAKAEKKAGRIAAEGLCCVALKDDKTAAVVEVNSETDFVAKNEEFQKFVAAVANQAVNSDAADMDAFLAESWNQDAAKTVKEALVDKIAVIGENLNIRRFEKVTAEDGCVVSYVHGGGRIGVIVEAATDVVNDAIKEALTNLAMQVAALSPKYVSTADVSEEYKAHEKEILLAQIANDPKMAGKPEKVIEGAVAGRLNKELKEVCLLEQVYVKAEDGKQTVAQYVAQVAKENGANITIKSFVRYETGEGLEKKVDDFAAEVAAQAGL
ncbi:MAG: elongation factor Ts [Lachnospiraceae bacterium]|nr:elongation factor Ts [Lachnospiraceae bacterium]